MALVKRKRRSSKPSKKKISKKASTRGVAKVPPKGTPKAPTKAAPKKRRPTARRTTRPAVPQVASVRAPALVDVVTFNTHGAIDKSGRVEREVGAYLRQERPALACFQELFFEEARDRLDRELLGDDPTSVRKTKDFEIKRGSDGAYAQRIATTGKHPISGATAGLAIYTSLPFKKVKFLKFDHSQVPDMFALKGVLTVEVSSAGFSFVAGVTHLHDSENDKVDGRARKANIQTLARSIEGASETPVVMVGDFNIDARARTGLDPGLLETLMKVGQRSWLEAGHESAVHNGLARPLPTTSTGNECLDYVMASGTGQTTPSLAAGTYRARDDFTSDHRLVRATLVFS